MKRFTLTIMSSLLLLCLASCGGIEVQEPPAAKPLDVSESERAQLKKQAKQRDGSSPAPVEAATKRVSINLVDGDGKPIAASGFLVLLDKDYELLRRVEFPFAIKPSPEDREVRFYGEVTKGSATQAKVGRAVLPALEESVTIRLVTPSTLVFIQDMTIPNEAPRRLNHIEIDYHGQVANPLPFELGTGSLVAVAKNMIPNTLYRYSLGKAFAGKFLVLAPASGEEKHIPIFRDSKIKMRFVNAGKALRFHTIEVSTGFDTIRATPTWQGDKAILPQSLFSRTMMNRYSLIDAEGQAITRQAGLRSAYEQRDGVFVEEVSSFSLLRKKRGRLLNPAGNPVAGAKSTSGEVTDQDGYFTTKANTIRFYVGDEWAHASLSRRRPEFGDLHLAPALPSEVRVQVLTPHFKAFSVDGKDFATNEVVTLDRTHKSRSFDFRIGAWQGQVSAGIEVELVTIDLRRFSTPNFAVVNNHKVALPFRSLSLSWSFQNYPKTPGRITKWQQSYYSVRMTRFANTGADGNVLALIPPMGEGSITNVYESPFPEHGYYGLRSANPYANRSEAQIGKDGGYRIYTQNRSPSLLKGGEKLVYGKRVGAIYTTRYGFHASDKKLEGEVPMEDIRVSGWQDFRCYNTPGGFVSRGDSERPYYYYAPRNRRRRLLGRFEETAFGLRFDVNFYQIEKDD